MSNPCKYARTCKYYRAENYTCADEDEASIYCGTYDVFADFELKQGSKKPLAP